MSKPPLDIRVGPRALSPAVDTRTPWKEIVGSGVPLKRPCRGCMSIYSVSLQSL